MRKYAALDVSMEQTAICVVDESGKKIIEGKVQTDPDTVTTWLAEKRPAAWRKSEWRPALWRFGFGTS